MKVWTRKRMIRYLAVLYFCVMAGLTFCSAWIQKMALPQIAIETVRTGYLNDCYYSSMIHTETVRYDEKGYSFVWIVENRRTPLGVRYFIRSVPVSVLAQEKEWSAVEGALERGTWIVFGRNDELEEGQQVKISE